MTALAIGLQEIAPSLIRNLITALQTPLNDYWVTIVITRDRTADHVIRAPSLYSAGWLYRFLHPTTEVLHVRPVLRTGSISG